MFLSALVIALGCLLSPPPGPVVQPFAPIGSYGGHWGIDIAAPPGSPVPAADDGVVTFAGTVAGRLSVTVHHGGGVRTSYSYLSAIEVSPGQRLRAGDVIGRSGLDHDLAAIHYSLRVDGSYLDPLVACRVTGLDGGLGLLARWLAT